MFRVTVLNVSAHGSQADVLGYADLCLERTPLTSGSCQIQVFDSVDGLESTARIDTPIAVDIWELVTRSLIAVTAGIEHLPLHDGDQGHCRYHSSWEQSR